MSSFNQPPQHDINILVVAIASFCSQGFPFGAVMLGHESMSHESMWCSDVCHSIPFSLIYIGLMSWNQTIFSEAHGSLGVKFDGIWLRRTSWFAHMLLTKHACQVDRQVIAGSGGRCGWCMNRWFKRTMPGKCWSWFVVTCLVA